MLLLLSGASGSGKTACLARLHEMLPDLVVHDFDTVGVPPAPTPAWRAHTNRYWVDRALLYQRDGRDMLLAGQTPLGELLSSPAATEIDGIAGCLLDCDDRERCRRLSVRPDEYGTEHFNWAEWHRRHAVDPQWEQHVIRAAAPEAAWSRWVGWRAGDPRWAIRTIDTTRLSIEQVAERVVEWVDEQRALHVDGVYPLGGRWWDDRA